MIISYDFGHTANGGDTSANGIIYEYAEIRKYAPVAIQVLEVAGHTCINCTPTQSGISLNESLAYRVNKANASGSQLHLCFHINAFNGSAHGAEIEVASDAGQRYGESVLNEICKLGFTRRGVNRPSLYVTKHTNMTAILVEPFFCDNAEDCKIYNPVTLGNAIARGILNVIGGNYQPTTNINIPSQPASALSKPVQSKTQNNFNDLNTFSFLQHQLNVQFGAGLAEDNIPGTLTLNACARCIVKQGARGDITKWIQNRLNKLGFNCGFADGIFGNMTANAIKSFQRKYGLVADGIIGINTWRKLLGL